MAVSPSESAVVDFMLHTVQLQRNAHLDCAHIRALRRLLRLLSSHLHTQSQASLALRHHAAMAVPSQLLVQQHVHVRSAAMTCIQHVWHCCMVRACRKHATTIVQAALRRHTVLH